MPELHSEWSASGFKQDMLCPGNRVLQADAPRTSTIYSAQGTAAHSLLEMCLRTGKDAAAFRGRILQADGFEFEVDDEMIENIQWCIDVVDELAGDDGVLMLEQKLYYAEYLDVEREAGWGTGDVVILKGSRVIVADLKYGKGVAVDVTENPQLMLYGLGAVAEHNGIAADLEEVELVILQPRISREPSRWTTTVEELEKWGRSTARSAVVTCQNAEGLYGGVPIAEWEATFLRPGEEQCRFCSAKATCPALKTEVALHVSAAPATVDEFEQITDPKTFSEPDLSRAMSACDLIEDWVTAVRAEVERRLLAGTPVPGFKLVQGKQGNRAWVDAKIAEETLIGMRLKQDEMYERKLISPTTAEKLLAKDSPRRWAKLQPHITRSEGKPHVAPLSDKRPALEMKPVADEFTAVPETFDDLA